MVLISSVWDSFVTFSAMIHYPCDSANTELLSLIFVIKINCKTFVICCCRERRLGYCSEWPTYSYMAE